MSLQEELNAARRIRMAKWFPPKQPKVIQKPITTVAEVSVAPEKPKKMEGFITLPAWPFLPPQGPVEPAFKTPPIARIVKLICQTYNVTEVDLKSSRRTARTVWPRQIAIHLAKKTTLKSYPEIGRVFGDRDHTTCLHAFRKIERLRKADAQLDAELSALERELGA